MKMELTINGARHRVDVSPARRLLDVLRLDLALTGTKEGCGEGECGACTVLLDGVAVNACLLPVAQAVGHEVITIEGVGLQPTAQAVQEALVSLGGAQCGFCTPGITLSAVSALTPGDTLSRHELRDRIAGNLCRCTGYQLIIDAVEDAGARLRRNPSGRVG